MTLPLIYKHNFKRRLPIVFEETDIARILYAIYTDKDYRKCSYEEWMRLRDVCCITTIYLCALRPKEACCLKFEDFDLGKTTVRIKADNNHIHKERIIPVPKIVFEYYKKYFEFPRARFWKGSPYLFPSMENQHISPKRVETVLREKALKPLSLWHPSHCTYNLRHSRACHIANKMYKETGQVDLYTLANFLDHADIRVTAYYYLPNVKGYQDAIRRWVDL